MNTAVKPITPEREQELVAKLVDFLSSRYDAGNLYDILRHGLGMVPSRFMRKIVCRLRLSEVSRQ